MIKKLSNSKGTLHKNAILNLIEKSYPKGIRQCEIVKKTNLSRQTVYNIAKILKEEDQIKEVDGKYLATDHYIHGFMLLADYLGETMVEKVLRKPPKIINASLCQKGMSKKILIEQSLFELANAIGAFIMYVFIEAVRPIKEPMSSNKKQDAIDYLINTSIPLDKMFIEFQKFFNLDKYHISDQTNEYDVDFKRIDNALKAVYPSLYEILEKGFFKHYQTYLVYQTNYVLTHIKCDHDWTETNVHKIGRVYVCKNCHRPSLSPKIINPTKVDENASQRYIYDIWTDMAKGISRSK